MLRKIFIMIFLAGFIFTANAENRRTIPLDVYLIIDGSPAFERSRGEIMAWINEQIVNRILINGDTVTIWAAGSNATIIHSSTISGEAEKQAIRDAVRNINAAGENADFSGAMSAAASRLTQAAGDRSRLTYTVLITGSARGMQQAFTGGAGHLFQWFRSEHSSQWQAFVMAPTIAGRVRQAAAAYMDSQR